MHLLWRQDLTVDITERLSPTTVVWTSRDTARRLRQASGGGCAGGCGTTFAYDGETVTIVKMATSGHGNEVVVEDRGGARRYQLSMRELLASGRASIITIGDGPARMTISSLPGSCSLTCLSGSWPRRPRRLTTSVKCSPDTDQDAPRPRDAMSCARSTHRICR